MNYQAIKSQVSVATAKVRSRVLRIWDKWDGLAAVLLLLLSGGAAGYFAGQANAALTIAQLQVEHSKEITRLQEGFQAALERKDGSARALVTTAAGAVQQAAAASRTADQAAQTAAKAAETASAAAQAAVSDERKRP